MKYLIILPFTLLMIIPVCLGYKLFFIVFSGALGKDWFEAFIWGCSCLMVVTYSIYFISQQIWNDLNAKR